MAEALQIGVRYCGGCNPRYDRVAAVERLQACLPEAKLCRAAPGQLVVLVVCGCPSQCVNVSELDGKLVWLCDLEKLDVAATAIRHTIRKQD